MEDRIIKKMTNGNFYILGLIISIALLILLNGIFMFVGIFVIDFNLNIGFSEIFREETLAGFTEMSELTLAVYGISQMLAEFLLAGLLIAFLYRHLVKDFKKFKENFVNYSLMIVVGFIAIFVFAYFLNEIYQIFGIEGTSENQETIDALISGRTGIFMIITTVLLAPFVEEIIFRKFLYGVVEEKFGLKPVFAVIVSAILFALIHAYDVFFFQYFAMAIVISASYAFSKKNIYVPIGIHFINNALVLLFFFLPFGAS